MEFHSKLISIHIKNCFFTHDELKALKDNFFLLFIPQFQELEDIITMTWKKKWTKSYTKCLQWQISFICSLMLSANLKNVKSVKRNIINQ